MQRFRQYLILLHRYLGIPLSVMFVVWFVSGIVMIYAGGMPSISAADRLARQAPLNPAAIRISPSAALEAASVVENPGNLTVRTVLGRPAYRFSGGYGGSTTVFADTGEILESISISAAAAIVSRYFDDEITQLAYTGMLTEPDQWTLTHRRALPLHEFRISDDNRTRIYVSATDGEIALVTTRTQRFFAWIGVIPHWLYFTPLRLNQPLWYWTVVGLSALGCVLAVLGLLLGITQFRRSRPFRLSDSVRYRGWMRWHYFTGVFFGIFALTWVFSGLMSMEPFAWMNARGLELPRSALAGEPLPASEFPALAMVADSPALSGVSIAEIEYTQRLGAPYFLVTPLPDKPDGTGLRERLHQPYPLALNSDGGQLLIDASTLKRDHTPITTDRLIAAVKELAKGVPIADAQLLDGYDAYYYSRNAEAPLPVLRIQFDDPMCTWYYIDPSRARVVARTHKYSRIERWLFNGLHSLDFQFWYDKRPLWDTGMITLSLGALATSAIGLFLGFRRMLPRKLQKNANQ